jgi:hypothetical protein
VAHDDQHASLSITERDGKVLLHCHAGCSQESVIGALRAAGLWPEPEHEARIVATYDYRDEGGVLLYQVVRLEPKGFRQRRPDGAGGWAHKLDGVRRVLYHLPELHAAAGRPVFIAEGEKDADNLIKLGLLATTNAGGAGKWRTDYSAALSGRDVVILPDNDEPGQLHAIDVARSLLGTAKSVRIVELSGLPPKADVSDWLAAGGSKEQLTEVVTTAKPLTAQDVADLAREHADTVQAGPWAAARQIDHFLNATDPEATWLIENILAREAITIIASPRGLGKTHLAYWWAIALARRGFRGLIIDRDNPKSEIRRRLKAWGAAGLADKLKIIARDEAPPLTDKAAWAAFPYRDYDFVILDSISAATEGVEEKDGGKAGAGLAPLVDAARHGPSVLLLANTTKDGLKIRGSGTLSDRADIVFEIRDATELKADPKHEAWWDALPFGGEHTWGDRAKRRRRRDSYRLALVTSKFRLGEEPNPICFEVHHDSDPWSVIEVTSVVEQQLDDAKRQAADAQQAKVDIAAAALKTALPIVKNPDAIDLLTAHDLSRNAARRLIEDRAGRDWNVAGAGTKKDPHILKPAAGNQIQQTPSAPMVSTIPIPAVTGAQGRQELMFKNDSLPMALGIQNSCQSFSDDEGEL